MSEMRSSLEQAVLLSIGAASLTRERAEAAVADLVRRGQIGGDEGRLIVERLLARVRGEGAAASGLFGRIEEGLQGAMREVGVVTRSELEDILLRLAELEHRLGLLERPPAAAPMPPPAVPPVPPPTVPPV